jgi:peroxiredoxin
MSLAGPAWSLAYLGGQAPALRLPDIERNVFDIGSLRGKPLVMTFWASWAESSVLELIFLEKNYERLKKNGYEVVAVNLDQRPSIARFFAERNKLSFPVLVDLDLVSLEKYQVLVVPTTFFISRHGRINEILVNFNQSTADRFKQIINN